MTIQTTNLLIGETPVELAQDSMFSLLVWAPDWIAGTSIVSVEVSNLPDEPNSWCPLNEMINLDSNTGTMLQGGLYIRLVGNHPSATLTIGRAD